MLSKRLLPLALLVFAPLACDFPTESDEETQISSTQAITAASSAGTVTIDLKAADTKLQIGRTTTLSYSVVYTRSPSEPLPTQLGLTTNLGNFGNAEGGPTTTTPALTFADSRECTRCTASGSLSFYAGTTTGSASVVASVASTTSTASITVAKATALFINSISPGFGASSGGTVVTINGQGFTVDPQPRVTFGTVLAQFVSSTETTITVNAPQSPSPVSTGSALVVDITVDVPATDVTNAQTDTLSGAFTYTAGGGAPPKLPSIQRIEASTTGTNAGDNAGGYTVQIYGINFINPVVVKIGSGSSVSTFSGVTADVDFVNGGQVTINSWPPATPDQLNKSVDILLQNQGSGLAVVSQSGFSYQSPDVLVDIEPTSITYYEAASTSVVLKVRGLDVSGSSNTLDTSRYTLAFGGETQCGSCGLSGPDSTGTFTITVPATGNGIAAVTPTSCVAQSGAATLTDRVTTETASGSTFTYDVEKPVVSSLSGSNTSCSAQPCDSESGGSTLTINGTFSTTELATAQVLVNGQSTSFTSSGCSAAPPLSSCSLSATVPAFTGSFDTATCTSSTGASGNQSQPKKVDVEVLYQSTTCNVTRSQAFTYEPADSSCVVTTTAPTAGFSAVVSSTNTLEVQFIDSSSGATSVEYFFGDGESQTCSESELPCTFTRTYSSSGNFTITQQARNSAGSDTASRSVKIGDDPVALISGPTSGTVNETLTFENASTGLDSSATCSWDWGDNSTPDLDCGSLSRPPTITHAYSAAGTYTIVLNLTNGLGSSTDTFQITITN